MKSAPNTREERAASEKASIWSRALTDPAQAVALAEGRSGDPFSVLGPHQTVHGRTLRAFLPGALAVTVIRGEDGGLLGDLRPGGDDGLFSGVVREAGPYRLRIDWPDAVQETEDPYSYGFLLGQMDLHLFAEGTHWCLAQQFGAVAMAIDGTRGVRFAVWAPNAQRVSVVGDFNSWDGRRHPMRRRAEAGVWELFIPHVGAGALYKYEIRGANGQVQP